MKDLKQLLLILRYNPKSFVVSILIKRMTLKIWKPIPNILWKIVKLAFILYVIVVSILFTLWKLNIIKEDK